MEALTNLAESIQIRAGGREDLLIHEGHKATAADIQKLERELEGLAREFKEAAGYDAGGLTTFGFDVEDEDQNNMDLESLAMEMQGETAHNKEMIAASTEFLAYTCALEIQRVYRAHIGRCKYRLVKDAWLAHSQKHRRLAPHAAVIIQKYWRRVLSTRAVAKVRRKALLSELEIAAVHVQRLARGNLARKGIKRSLSAIARASANFFSSGGRTEDHLRNRLQRPQLRPAPVYNAETWSDSDQTTSCESSLSSDEWQGWSADSPAKSQAPCHAAKRPSGTSFRALGNAGGGGTLARGSGGQSETAKKDWQVVEEERLKLTRVRKPLPDWGTVDDSDDY